MAVIPTIDVEPLTGSTGDRDAVARQIDTACREHGFFVIVGHGLDPDLLTRLEEQARSFFALPEAIKAEIAMARGGRAWRGWFPAGGELTGGVPDGKEGIYFGAELSRADPRVAAGIPLHGPNLFPARPVELRDAVLTWIDTLTRLGRQLMGGIALGLGLDEAFFARHVTADPTILFRIFRYPAAPVGTDAPSAWGVGEHTDYGLLTILGQDDTGGLEVRGPEGWIEVPPSPGALVCNLGDMLDRMTGGRYRSTPHRVRRPDRVDRIAFPFFFDPGWDVDVRPLALPDSPPADHPDRWDGADLRALTGTYGEYLVGKVWRVFPLLGGDVLDPDRRP
ncbi:MAG: isopenicillin N synthase family dioxygenase [Acidimicrobiia bacterium]